jgi:DNA-binding NtrC family response regulator
MMEAPRVLLVEDDEGLRVTVAANLELEGFEVVEASAGEEALALVRAGERFNVVFSDIRMPGLSGVELYFELKMIDPHLPVVLMTAFSNEDTINRAIEGGVFTVLAKPFDVEKTVATLQRAAGRPIVLVVDDVPAVATTTADALSAMGLRTKAVFGGEAALAAIRDEAIDVCVTDLAMPDINGVEVGRRGRMLVPAVVVIVFSGAPGADAMMRVAAAEGAWQCMRKPVDPVALAHSIAYARGRKEAYRR